MADSGWSVGMSPHRPGVIYLNLGTQKVILPALEGFKMGVALRAAAQQSFDPDDDAAMNELAARQHLEEAFERIRERSSYGDYAEARNRLVFALEALQGNQGKAEDDDHG